MMRLRGRSRWVLLLVSLAGVVAFGWPLLADPESGLGHSDDAPLLFALLIPLLLLVVLGELADGGMDAKAVAMLGLLSAVGAGLRVLGTGTAGIEPIFVLLVLAGRVFGPGFGFALGNLSLLASALATGGVGPWLPFQMLGAGWVALGAGLLPRATGRREVWLLAGYGAAAGLAYGLLLNLWFWPFTTPATSTLAYNPDDPLATNLLRFLAFHLATSLGWDLPRAIFTATVILLAGAPVLAALRRAVRRAAFDAPVEFVEAAR